MSRLCFDYGHGGKDSGAIFNGRKESDDVLNIGRAIASEVRKYGVIVDETRTFDVTVNLNDRCNIENRNKYDYFISFHRNSYKPEKAEGVEVYTCLNAGVKVKRLSQVVQKSLIALGFIDRGIKEANYQVLRETKAPAILIEIGFIDNSKDNNLFDSKKNEIIKAISKAILSELGIVYKEEFISNFSNDKTLYRVMAGSFSNRKNAEEQVKKLKRAGFDVTIMKIN